MMFLAHMCPMYIVGSVKEKINSIKLILTLNTTLKIHTIFLKVVWKHSCHYLEVKVTQPQDLLQYLYTLTCVVGLQVRVSQCVKE